MKHFMLWMAVAGASLVAPVHADGIDRLRAFIAGAKTAEADFSQTVADKAGRVTQRASGHMAFARPGRFRWDYHAPYAQTIVGDGKKLWLYDPDLEQVTVKTLGDAIAATPAALLAGDDAIERYFALTTGPNVDGLEWLTAVPKQQDNTFERVRMGFRGDTLTVMQLTDHFGQTTTLTLKELKRNPAITASTFHFVPPAGVDLIGD